MHKNLFIHFPFFPSFFFFPFTFFLFYYLSFIFLSHSSFPSYHFSPNINMLLSVTLETCKSFFNNRSWEVLLNINQDKGENIKHIYWLRIWRSRVLHQVNNFCSVMPMKVILIFTLKHKNRRIPYITSFWCYLNIFYFCLCSIEITIKTNTTKLSMHYLSFFVWMMTWRSMIHLVLPK